MRRTSPRFVDVAAWVDSERVDPVQRRRRQAIHILLAAIAAIRPPYTLYLKGGLLLGLVYNSPRMTVDIDLTAGFQPLNDIDDRIKEELNRTLPATAAMLGYAGTQTQVHQVKKLPKQHAHNIEGAQFPALKITIEHVSASGGQRHRDRIPIDISFNEPKLGSIDIFDIGDGVELYAYGLIDVIAEKYRALLHQRHRRRGKGRRQDIYDIDFLRAGFEFSDKEKAEILDAIFRKCQARSFEPEIGSMDDQAIREITHAEWDSIKLELKSLPEFNLCFENVQRFYRDLPWNRTDKHTPTPGA